MKPHPNPKQYVLTMLLIYCFRFSSFSQVKFDSGYFINNENVRTNCLIKNKDWHYNPNSFEYKLSDNSGVAIALIKDVKEFGVSGYSSYIRANVKLDRSRDLISDPADLSDSRDPQWSTETLFLKLVYAGGAKLYTYEERNLARYFYSAGADTIEQLIYKAFRVGETNVGYNNTYLGQLAAKLDCGEATQARLNKTDYSESSLIKYFEAFDKCKGMKSEALVNTIRRRNFAFSILAAFSYADLTTQNSTGFDQYSNPVNFEGQWNPVVGAELEYILPFGANKWSIPLNMYNRNYNATHSDSIGVSDVKYNAIEVGVGVRYKAFLSEKVNIFLNGMVVLDFKTNSSYKGITPPWLPEFGKVDISTNAPILAGGLGMEYKRISAEFRYFSTRDLFVYANNWGSAFNSYAVFLKFRLFKF